MPVQYRYVGTLATCDALLESDLEVPLASSYQPAPLPVKFCLGPASLHRRHTQCVCVCVCVWTCAGSDSVSTRSLCTAWSVPLAPETLLLLSEQTSRLHLRARENTDKQRESANKLQAPKSSTSHSYRKTRQQKRERYMFPLFPCACAHLARRGADVSTPHTTLTSPPHPHAEQQ